MRDLKSGFFDYKCKRISTRQSQKQKFQMKNERERQLIFQLQIAKVTEDGNNINRQTNNERKREGEKDWLFDFKKQEQVKAKGNHRNEE